MDRYEKAKRLSDTDFKQIMGVTKGTFDAMTGVLNKTYAEKHKRCGRHAKPSIKGQLFMSLKYRRQYVTQKEPAYEFEAGEATAHDVIVWVGDTLVKSGQFKLPGKKALPEGNEIETALAGVTESPIERPKKNNANGAPGKRNGIR